MSDKKILIVDDVQSMRLVVKYTLGTMGIKNVDQASNGQQAIKYIKNNQYDLVISDMEMPILNGIELLKFIRADEKFKNLNVIMLTSVSDEEQIREALSQGIDNYVLKPINPNILQKRIAAALKF